VARLTIGDLDDHVIYRLQERAQANEHSLEGEIRHVLTERANPRSRIVQFRARFAEDRGADRRYAADRQRRLAPRRSGSVKLTVDASVVAKWFVTEPQSEEAFQLLAPRIRRHAPDILLVECANVIWKKVRRREISDPQPYLEELPRLPEMVTLHRSADFLDHAARLAMDMHHPVYDCLYLACADATTSVLITADHRFAKKAAVSSVEVWTIGSAGVADRIEMAATAPIIRGERIEELIKLHEFFAGTERHVLMA